MGPAADGWRRQDGRITSPVVLSTTTRIICSGVEVGLPGVGSACWAGLNSAPWHGQTNSCELLSQPTVHPACVQIRLYATTLPFARRTTAAGPTPGAVKPSACPTRSESRFVMVRPWIVGVGLGDGDWVAGGGAVARVGSRCARS